MSDTPKKISLQDAIKQQLANKKKKAGNELKGANNTNQTKQLKSQQSKKTMNTRRKMGG
ncbi:hypothetical protein [Evansella cellulosilytica]|uniref:DUF5302 domain-containing protein n=1 Tax=Evansella cellulosilytica (strain ATCC 21833 / DSM 2522 / FERM P-1141 / JCM 9156 / N-4) TaxID=649639 RepID=E6TQM2_EVAC2|nr:hypothetical protein [Evansella cellulosilytica]ADU30533.1 hypothetical protein Bcell_2273 [Evansella cellulosilytica DSM 2522]